MNEPGMKSIFGVDGSVCFVWKIDIIVEEWIDE